MILDQLSCHANWFLECFELMKAISKQWLQELTFDELIKSKVSTDSEFQFSGKDIHISLLSRYYEKAIGFQKWDRMHNLDNKTKKREQMLHFILYYIQDHKLKMSRWKFLHYILPIKTKLQFSWNIALTP